MMEKKAKGMKKMNKAPFEEIIEEPKKKSSSPEKSPDNEIKPKMKAKAKGGKRKKEKKLPDPEVLKEQFEVWKGTDEYKKWLELSEFKKDYPEITETSGDLTGKWQMAEDKIWAFSKLFKVKTKMKDLKHEHVRSFFFAREDKDNFQIDGVMAGVVKEHSDGAWHLRRKFIEIWKALDDVSEVNENDFQAARKKMGKDLTELYKLMQPHIKGPHKEIYHEKLSTILKPLADLLKSNMRLSIFEDGYPDVKSREVVDFKYNALKARFCEDLQAVWHVLYAIENDPEKKLIASPDVKNIFKKLEYSDWERSPIEFFYLSKLRKTFFMARKHMVKLFVNGIDFWKIPLSNNEQFLEDMKRLVDYELICERLLGDPLKRDQLNFMHRSLDLVMRTPGQNKMLDKEETFTKLALPKLLIYKGVQRIRAILDAKNQQKLKDEVECVQGGFFFQFSISKMNIPKEILDSLDSQTINDLKNRPQSAFVGGTNQMSTTIRPKSALAKDPPQEPFEETKLPLKDKLAVNQDYKSQKLTQYDRIWVFERYVDEETQPIFYEAAEELRHINLSVQQDIEDSIITEGMNISRDALEHREKYKDEIKKAREFLDHLKLQDNKKDDVNSRRPPMLWNDPINWEETHNYRSIAAPQECYKDNRIQNFMEKIEYLAQHLLQYQSPWIDDIIVRTIDVFKNDFQPAPKPYEVYLHEIKNF